MSELTNILHEIGEERLRQTQNQTTNELDETNTPNDFVAYITAYAGRAAAKCPRNERQGENFRENMIKVAALAVAAIQTHG